MHLTSPTLKPTTVFWWRPKDTKWIFKRQLINIERLVLPNHRAASYPTENRYLSHWVISHKTDETFRPVTNRSRGFRHRCCLATLLLFSNTFVTSWLSRFSQVLGTHFCFQFCCWKPLERFRLNFMNECQHTELAPSLGTCWNICQQWRAGFWVLNVRGPRKTDNKQNITGFTSWCITHKEHWSGLTHRQYRDWVGQTLPRAAVKSWLLLLIWKKAEHIKLWRQPESLWETNLWQAAHSRTEDKIPEP